MVNTDTGANKIFRVLEHNMFEDMQIQTFGYFGLQVVRNVNQVLTNPLTVSDLTQLSGGHSIEIKIPMIRCT